MKEHRDKWSILDDIKTRQGTIKAYEDQGHYGIARAGYEDLILLYSELIATINAEDGQ